MKKDIEKMQIYNNCFQETVKVKMNPLNTFFYRTAIESTSYDSEGFSVG